MSLLCIDQESVRKPGEETVDLQDYPLAAEKDEIQYRFLQPVDQFKTLKVIEALSDTVTVPIKEQVAEVLAFGDGRCAWKVFAGAIHD